MHSASSKETGRKHLDRQSRMLGVQRRHQPASSPLAPPSGSGSKGGVAGAIGIFFTTRLFDRTTAKCMRQAAGFDAAWCPDVRYAARAAAAFSCLAVAFRCKARHRWRAHRSNLIQGVRTRTFPRASSVGNEPTSLSANTECGRPDRLPPWLHMKTCSQP